jgi:deoxyribodipyrimidine photolyase-like uncharacterized protein
MTSKKSPKQKEKRKRHRKRWLSRRPDYAVKDILRWIRALEKNKENMEEINWNVEYAEAQRKLKKWIQRVKEYNK